VSWEPRKAGVARANFLVFRDRILVLIILRSILRWSFRRWLYGWDQGVADGLHGDPARHPHIALPKRNFLSAVHAVALFDVLGED